MTSLLTLLESPDNWLALATLSLLEIVLGIDNIIFLSLLLSRLPASQQKFARVLGLSLAMLTRLALLFSIVWLTRLTRPLWIITPGHDISVRDLILIGGGLFLIIKSVLEIRSLVGGLVSSRQARPFGNLVAVVIEIALIDVIFSLDSVFTAVGLAKPNQVPIMAAAIVIAILVMMGLSAPIARFIERQPGIKTLALAFLVVIGAALIVEALDFELPRAYLYVPLAFAFLIELLNIRRRHNEVRRGG